MAYSIQQRRFRLFVILSGTARFLFLQWNRCFCIRSTARIGGHQKKKIYKDETRIQYPNMGYDMRRTATSRCRKTKIAYV